MGSVQEAVRAAQSTRYAHLASGSIIIYDHLITLDEEFNLIWRGPWSLSKVLFLLNRYYFLFAVLFNIYGLMWGKLTDTVVVSHLFSGRWTGWFATALAEVILQMRIYALYFVEGRKIIILMVTCFISTTSASAAIMGLALSRLQVVSKIPTTNRDFCVSSNVPDWFYVFWIPTLCFESLLCGLAIFRGFQTFKRTGGLFLSGRHVVKILIRDSIVYFLILFVTYLVNMLIWLVGPVDLLEIPIGFTCAFSCVLGNRVILNVKRANQEEPERDSSPPMVATEGSSVEMIQLQSLRSSRERSSHGRW